MRTALLIPVKSFGNAKQRLGAALDQQHRTLLAEAMLRDVLTAASGVTDRLHIFLVTGDLQAQSMARDFPFGVIEDQLNESETAAIGWRLSGAWLMAMTPPWLCLAIFRLITSAELHRVLDSAPDEGAVFVPAYDRRGSNCILRRPASIIPLCFGNDSFMPHCEAMKRTGKPLVILEMPGIGLDIDNPHELAMLMEREGDTHAQRLLRSWTSDPQCTLAWEAAG